MYRITRSYTWYKTDYEKYIIMTYYINMIPFTFDDIPEDLQNNQEIIEKAEQQITMTPEIFFRSSFYLIDEECHPCLFELDLENPEVLDEIS